ncbi:MAG: HAD family phosphatase, partial [Candidatus Neomarinimicrobiota bacterium]
SRDIIEASFPEFAHNDYERGKITDLEFFQALKKALPQPNQLNEMNFWRGWSLLVGNETDAVDILKDLSRHMPIWIISNTNPRHIQEESKRFSFFEYVTGTVYSYHSGSRKPEPEIFATALEQADANPSESLFIDDRSDNVDQARKLGFQAVIYESADQLKTEIKKLGLEIA